MAKVSIKIIEELRNTGLEEKDRTLINADAKNSGTLGAQIKTARYQRKLKREEVGEGLLSELKLRRLEEENEWEFWSVRILMGRLHIPAFATIFYLNARDNVLVNLEMDIVCDLRFWRYEKAQKEIEQFYSLCDRKNRFQMQVYYRLYVALKVRQKKSEEKDKKNMQEFMEEEMPGFEERLLKGKLFAPDELALIALYYQLMEEDTAGRLQKLYYIVHYYREEFAKEEERLQPFYAELMLACAQCQYELEDYINCVAQCEEGIKVTSHTRICIVGGELYEWMADAKGKLLEEEIYKEKQRYLKKETKGGEETKKNSLKGNSEGERNFLAEGTERKRRVSEILEDYERADVLYKKYYNGCLDNKREELKGKIERWRIIMLEI